ncbi:MAG: hypothetical protein CVV46_07045 [Spirochaetae bacterium HGW-Spirochaetae-2]|jgi:FKBP-type peptidyl-prolyl cis-trans isomerase|nr:MAG: hypothetical protein CVV46_07045 [Spirochaetae bacterium HGW-Spirochaetae-2]
MFGHKNNFPKEYRFMKKFSILAILLLATALIVSCTGTKAETAPTTTTESTQTVPATAAQSTVVSEPVVQAEEAPVVESKTDTIVIDTAPAITADDPELDQKFSYVYGHLLANNIIGQGIDLAAGPFISGSADFFNYADPKLTEEEINNLFMQYQGFLDGVLTETDLEAGIGEDAGELASFRDRFSYGYGYVVQYNLQSQGIIVVLKDFNSGISDAYAEIPLPYTDEDIDALFTAYQDKLMAEYDSMVREYAAQNLVEAETFLAENSQLEGVVTTESGLQYKVMSAGNGAIPTAEDTVELDYMITFLDGSTGDNSYSRGEPSVFGLSNLIPGFSEGVRLMPVGSHYRFYVHPSLAYGEMGNEMIPPNTLLIFDVELHDIVK